ncbi:hypothetical protein F3Y22_tig00110478pilonHSYRG00035 [Hibiscus syriacus]|uniref:TFIIS N-terminal domain-containing protein n=1 Tax=Hibiscus syriacus TaxID=106335 RepID=A0A6A3AEE3_HIBSY|nr:hypothetical protein F3Y22_tig00110478pilonHSYRG00035 [Hibiscus syriacus]
MERELVDLFEAASTAADLAISNAVSSNGPEVSRCVDVLNLLKAFPITYDILLSTKVGKRLRRLTVHPREKIHTVASNLLESWKKLLLQEIAKRKKNGTFQIHKTSKAIPTTPINVVEKAVTTMRLPVKLGENEANGNTTMADKTATEAFSIVADEIDVEEMLNQVNACDPIQVTLSVETAMFLTLGKTYGTQQHKYSAIMSNLTDPNNPDLRRKVLLGEIKPGSLISMTPVYQSLWSTDDHLLSKADKKKCR